MAVLGMTATNWIVLSLYTVMSLGVFLDKNRK